jgi:hypothetical protein
MTATLLRVLVVLLGAAAPGGSAAAETLNSQYLVYAGGFKALGIDARAELEANRYAVRGTLKTMGFVDWILGFTQTLESKGRIDGGVLPQTYVSDGVFWRNKRITHLSYSADRRVAVTLVPPNEEDSDRPKVPEELTVGTFDPLSAYMAANVGARTGSPCNGTFPVFDGRRRYDVMLEEDGVGNVEPSAYSSFSGPALRCKFSQRRITGFQRNPRFDPKTPRVSILYLARFGEGGVWLPVRLESDSNFGYVIGHLVGIDAPAKSLAQK